ncbi:caspase domain-containing protein [Scheffersomyces xylosifermentans]|uniref:caspase domain-containing protein n=1 Tax=Scheffersomyces xylosifermentans TaxID=1304137 RepID=UPI00315DFCA9
MFPGSGRHSYNNNAPPPQGQGGYYAPPQGPPPSGYSSYGPPQGPPPQQYQQQYQQPPQQQYSRPSAPPPPRDQYGSQNQYARPTGPPPSAPQSFGQNTNFTFQYSNCSGRKKALLVGINYFGSQNELRGCVNDVKNMSSFLVERWGYRWEDIVILTDDQRDIQRVPTKDNIFRAMQWLVKDARPNDSLVFHYSGHGGTTKDLDGDEESGMDDVIYPVDFQQVGHIVDDDMHAIMVRPLPPGCRLTALYDSCHSGTALDLPYVYSTKGVVKEPNLLKDAGGDALSAFMAYETGNIGGAISSLTGLVKKVARSGGGNQEQIRQMKTSPADVISISGCKDDQTSADAKENGRATGAMSWAFIKVLTELPNQSYLSLLNNMRTILAQKYSQKPQLSCSHPQDMNIQFIL